MIMTVGRDNMGLPKQGCREELPSLIKHIASKSVSGFDNVDCCSGLSPHSQSTSTPNPCADLQSGKGSESINSHTDVHLDLMSSMHSAVQAIESHHSHSVSISLPSTPSGLHIERSRKALFLEKGEPMGTDEQPDHPANSTDVNTQQLTNGKFYSQPMPAGNLYGKATAAGKVTDPLGSQQWINRNNSMKDKRYDSFKTWSGKLERQLSHLHRKTQEADEVANDSQITETEPVPAVERYFDALEGPELDTLKASEVLILPEDKKWPFLLRFPISSFGMCLGVSSQAILWKTLATSPSTSFLHVSLTTNHVLWCISLALMGIVSSIYSLKIIFYFEAVRREYYHPIRVNFFFAPWIACLFLVLSVPPSVAENLHAALWYVLMAPILCLELKIYGQWMSGGQRRLSKVANPSNHLAIVGNFVGALLGASMGLKEGPIFFFAVGLAHYTVLFVTLYQRLPTNKTLPKELHPVFFLFVAAPSVASMAWAKINGNFDFGSKIAYFIAMFLYASLAVRINFFRGFRFSLAWWAYTFPMTGASVATIRYSNEVTTLFTRSLSVGLSAISTFTVTALLVSTIIHAFVLHDLFPNDISIAITEKRPKSSKKQTHLRPSSSDMKDIEASVSVDIP